MSYNIIFVLLDEMVILSSKYEVVNTALSSIECRMQLTIRQLTATDFGGYRCIAKNSLGEVDSIIRLYGEYSLFIYNSINYFHLKFVNYYNIQTISLEYFRCLHFIIKDSLLFN